MKKKNIIFLLIALMTVGFASVTTNLMVNGSITLGNDIKDHDIKFTKSILNDIEDNSLISEDGKKINYNISLSKTNKASELVYEITNNSNQYDAEVDIT